MHVGVVRIKRTIVIAVRKNRNESIKLISINIINISRWNLTFLLTKSILKYYTIYNRSYLG